MPLADRALPRLAPQSLLATLIFADFGQKSLKLSEDSVRCGEGLRRPQNRSGRCMALAGGLRVHEPDISEPRLRQPDCCSLQWLPGRVPPAWCRSCVGVDGPPERPSRVWRRVGGHLSTYPIPRRGTRPCRFRDPLLRLAINFAQKDPDAALIRRPRRSASSRPDRAASVRKDQISVLQKRCAKLLAWSGFQFSVS